MLLKNLNKTAVFIIQQYYIIPQLLHPELVAEEPQQKAYFDPLEVHPDLQPEHFAEEPQQKAFLILLKFLLTSNRNILLKNLNKRLF